MKYLLLALPLMLILACSDSEDGSAEPTSRVDSGRAEADESPTQRPTREPSNTPAPTALPTSAPSGTSRRSPAPIGEAVVVAGWRVTVNSVVPDGTSLVMAENQFNDPPAAGRQFFIANITATYVDGEEESSTLFSDISVSALGPSSVEYQDFSDTCGVVPDEVDSFKDVFEGGSVTGNVCWSVTTADAAALLMYGEPSFSFEDRDRRWWSLAP